MGTPPDKKIKSAKKIVKTQQANKTKKIIN